MTHIDLVENPSIRRRDRVVEWLITTGWEILALHYYKGRIPIIAKKGKQVAFITIHATLGHIPRRKNQGMIRTAAQQWLTKHDPMCQHYSFDTVTFPEYRQGTEPGFTYTPNAWRL